LSTGDLGAAADDQRVGVRDDLEQVARRQAQRFHHLDAFGAAQDLEPLRRQ
jgi:hypothetical protein